MQWNIVTEYGDRMFHIRAMFGVIWSTAFVKQVKLRDIARRCTSDKWSCAKQASPAMWNDPLERVATSEHVQFSCYLSGRGALAECFFIVQASSGINENNLLGKWTWITGQSFIV